MFKKLVKTEKRRVLPLFLLLIVGICVNVGISVSYSLFEDWYSDWYQDSYNSLWQKANAERIAAGIKTPREYCDPLGLIAAYPEDCDRVFGRFEGSQQYYEWESKYSEQWYEFENNSGMVQFENFMEFFIWVPIVIGVLLMIPWVITGIIGGIRITIKKLAGTSWWIFMILFGLIPLAIWLIFLAFTGILGVWAWNWSIPMLPSKRRCAQCKGWNDYAATRCSHCSQPLS